MSVLVVVAHPDDEVLGCGATGAAMAARGHSVRACFLSGHVEARAGRPDVSRLLSNVNEAQRLMGFGRPFIGPFPNLRMNTVPHVELVQFIEQAIQEAQAQVVFTHHPADLNNDHLQVARACLAAARLSQRRAGVPRLRRMFYMEVLSSTDWSYPGGSNGFVADTFVQIGRFLDTKIEALRAYEGVMRPFPHPRSEEVLRGLAAYRGAQAGLDSAEAFQTAFSAAENADELLAL